MQLGGELKSAVYAAPQNSGSFGYFLDGRGLGFHRFGPLEPATGRAALVLARETDSFAIHPEFKISQFAELLNENYVGILSVPLEGGSAITRRDRKSTRLNSSHLGIS